MFTQENIGCHKTRFCDGLALNKSQNRKKALTNQSLLKKLRFFKVKSLVKAFKQDVVCDDDIKRFAFYHAGNCLVQTLLLRHPKTSLFFTEPKIDQNVVLIDDVVVGVREANKSQANMTKLSGHVRDLISNSEKLLSIETRISLETLLIGFYAGKVGEFFDRHTPRYTTQLKKHSFLTTTQSVASALPFDVVVGVRSCKTSFCKNKSQANMTKPLSLHIHAKIDQFLYQSDIGLSERVKATSLVKHRLVNGSSYSANFFNLQKNSILGNLNKTEILERKIFALFQNLEREIDTVYGKQLQTQSYSLLFAKRTASERVQNEVLQEQGKQSKALLTGNNGALATTNFFSSKKIDTISQNRETSAWCEEMVCKALTFYKKPYGHWFRIYLPQIETHQRQPVSLDKFFTKSREFLLSETASIANSSYSRRLQSFTLLKAEQSSNKAKPLLIKSASINTFVKVKTSFDKQCLSKPLPKQSFGQRFLFSKAPYVKKSTFSNNPVTYNCETFAKRFALASLRSDHPFVQSTHLKKDHFYTFAYNSNNIVTQTLGHLWPQEFSHGTHHNLVLNTFSQTFNLIGKNRELFDILADHFIRFGKIRMPEILRICRLYVEMSNLQGQNYIFSEEIEKTKQ